MKRLNSSDSLGGLMSIYPNSTVDADHELNNPMYTRDFETMLEGLDEEESGHISEKKRRLRVDQVKALEKNFEVENKLEPERKVKLAQELGLQPRQVAVWFQNRRARWKTKQLERDYGLLKASYNSLKLKFDSLQRENESLLDEIRELKSIMNGDESKSIAVKEEAALSVSEEKCDLEIDDGGAAAAMNMESEMIGGGVFFGDFKDGSSDSDSSAILNENNNSNSNSSPIVAAISSSTGIHHRSPKRFCGGGGAVSAGVLGEATKNVYEAQLVKIEEHNFLGEESCSTLFSDDQPPTLHWYCNDEWN